MAIFSARRFRDNNKTDKLAQPIMDVNPKLEKDEIASSIRSNLNKKRKRMNCIEKIKIVVMVLKVHCLEMAWLVTEKP